MSHVASVDLEVKDLDALAESCSRLGLELVRGQTHYRWYGMSVGDYPLPAGFTREDLGSCEHAIRVRHPEAGQQPYEIGVCRRRDCRPGYQLLWDFWQGGYGLQAKVGENCKLLRKEYATTAAIREARMRGFSVTEQRHRDGSIRLVLSK